MKWYGKKMYSVAEKIRELRNDVLLIFITVFIDYALEGYRLNSLFN